MYIIFKMCSWRLCPSPHNYIQCFGSVLFWYESGSGSVSIRIRFRLLRIRIRIRIRGNFNYVNLVFPIKCFAMFFFSYNRAIYSGQPEKLSLTPPLKILPCFCGFFCGHLSFIKVLTCFISLFFFLRFPPSNSYLFFNLEKKMARIYNPATYINGTVHQFFKI